MKRNIPQNFDANVLKPESAIKEDSIKNAVKQCEDESILLAKTAENQLGLIKFIDLTTLSATDTRDKVRKLVDRAYTPLTNDVANDSGRRCAAVWRVSGACARCERTDERTSLRPEVYTSLPVRPVSIRDGTRFPRFSVAGGFPTGMYRLESRLLEIRLAIEDGADEIDTVINRPAALDGHWTEVYTELRQMREACGEHVHLKTILAVGELETYENVYAASMCAMLAGSDFIKTSTGKETVNATLEYTYVMCVAIKHYYEKTKIRVGFKPAGGISTPAQALAYYSMVKLVLGADWLTPDLFRIGASSLLGNIQTALSSL